MGMVKRAVSIFLAAVLLLGLVPALAAEEPFLIENGVLVAYTGTAAKVTVPQGVQIIGRDAFAGKQKLTGVVLPDSVTDIESGAFAQCWSLKDVTMSKNLVSLGDAAFYGCEQLKTLALPQSLRTIGYDALGGCPALTLQIPSGVTSIVPYGTELRYCKKVGDFYMAGDGILVFYTGSAANLVIPDWVKAIAGDLYRFNYDGLMKLRSVSIPGTVKTVGRGAFFGASNLESATLGEGVVELGDSVFSNCPKLAALSLPSTLKRVGISALGSALGEQAGGINRTGGYIPWLTAQKGPFVVAGDGVLVGYNGNDQHIVVPEGVKSIGGGVFSHFRDQQLGIHAPKAQPITVQLPESLVEIGPYAFQECDELEQINLPSGLTRIGESAFYGCYALSALKIPDGVTVLPDHVLDSCRSLRTLTLPKGLTELGEFALSGCKELTVLTLPDGLRTIGRGAFGGAYGLKHLVLPAGLAFVDQNAFPAAPPFSLTVLGAGTRFDERALGRNKATGGEQQQYDIYAPKNAAVRPVAARAGLAVKDPLMAAPTTSRVLVNGREVAFEAYLIGQNNYFKLRDLAAAFNGTLATFAVSWDEVQGAVEIVASAEYLPVGGELRPGDGVAKAAQPGTAPFYYAGTLTELATYVIGGNNYVMLRDLTPLLGFSVDWDQATDTINIDADYAFGY